MRSEVLTAELLRNETSGVWQCVESLVAHDISKGCAVLIFQGQAVQLPDPGRCRQNNP